MLKYKYLHLRGWLRYNRIWVCRIHDSFITLSYYSLSVTTRYSIPLLCVIHVVPFISVPVSHEGCFTRKDIVIVRKNKALCMNLLLVAVWLFFYSEVFQTLKLELVWLSLKPLPGAQCHVTLHLLRNIHNAQVNSVQHTVPCCT